MAAQGSQPHASDHNAQGRRPCSTAEAEAMHSRLAADATQDPIKRAQRALHARGAARQLKRRQCARALQYACRVRLHAYAWRLVGVLRANRRRPQHAQHGGAVGGHFDTVRIELVCCPLQLSPRCFGGAAQRCHVRAPARATQCIRRCAATEAAKMHSQRGVDRAQIPSNTGGAHSMAHAAPCQQVQYALAHVLRHA